MLTLREVEPAVLEFVLNVLRTQNKIDPVIPEKLADSAYLYRLAYDHGRASIVSDLEAILKDTKK